MSVDDISLFRRFCQFIHCLIFILETLLSLVLHCFTTLLYIHRFTHTRFILTIPLPLPLYHTAHPLHLAPSLLYSIPHLFHSTPPYFLTSYIKMCNLYIYIYIFFSLSLTTCVMVLICT